MHDLGVHQSHLSLPNRRKLLVVRESTHEKANRIVVRLHHQPDVGWAIDVECTGKYVPDHMQPAHLEGPTFSSTRDWKDLAGEEFKVSYNDGDLHPIMPDNPRNIYVGWHAAPNNHRIKLLKRTRNRFLVDWRCEAKESANDGGVPVWVYAEIPFTEVIVWSENRIPLDQVKRLMDRHFDPTEFHPPEFEDIQDGTRVAFKVRSSAE